jgi:hypothetical protein
MAVVPSCLTLERVRSQRDCKEELNTREKRNKVMVRNAEFIT